MLIIAFWELGIVLAEAGLLVVLLAIARQGCQGRHAARPEPAGRHAASPLVDHGSYAGPGPAPGRHAVAEIELTGEQRITLAGIVSWAEQDAGPAAIANGRHLADMIRYDELCSDVAAAGVLLHLLSFAKSISELPEVMFSDVEPAELADVVAEAIGGAVFDLSALHRATA